MPEITTQKMPVGPAMKFYLAKGNAGTYLVATLDLPEAANETDEKLQARLDNAGPSKAHGAGRHWPTP